MSAPMLPAPRAKRRRPSPFPLLLGCLVLLSLCYTLMVLSRSSSHSLDVRSTLAEVDAALADAGVHRS